MYSERLEILKNSSERAWNEMAKEDGTAAVLTIHADSVIAQLRSAGYSVVKGKKPQEISDEDLAEFFN